MILITERLHRDDFVKEINLKEYFKELDEMLNEIVVYQQRSRKIRIRETEETIMKFGYNYYKEMVMLALESRFGKDNVREVSIVKNNDVELEGVNIRMESTNVSPIIYFDKSKEFYDETDVFSFLEQAEYAYKEGRYFIEQGMEDLYEWEKARKLLRPRVVNHRANSQRLKGLPHVCRLDLAVIFAVEVTDSLDTGDSGVITVSKHLMERWKVNEETLYLEAIKNMENSKYSIENMNTMMERLGMDEMLIPVDEEKMGMFVGTCCDGIGGASVILSQKILEEFREKMGCSKVFVLPSSINEVILVDADMGDASSLRAVVQEVNRTEVSEMEYLSDNVYCFYNGILEVAV